MADLTSLLSNFLGGSNNDASPVAPVPQTGGAATGQTGLNLLSNTEPMTGETVLAKLKVPKAKSTGVADGIGGAVGGGMGAVKSDSSKIGALAQGFGGAMKSSAELRAAQQKALTEQLKAYWDHADKLATRAQTAVRDANTATYQKGLVENGARDKTDVTNDAYKSELARSLAAKRFGMQDPILTAHANGIPAKGEFVQPSPDMVKAAQDELGRRQKVFEAWDAGQPWNKDGKKGSTAMPTAPTEGVTDETPAPETPGSGDNPAAAPATSAPPPSAGSWRTIHNPKTNEQMLWNDATGETKPFDGATPASPTPAGAGAMPPPAGFTGDDQLPGFGG